MNQNELKAKIESAREAHYEGYISRDEYYDWVDFLYEEYEGVQA